MPDIQYVFTPDGVNEQFSLIKQELGSKADNVLTTYVKPQSTSAITTTDTIPEAIGKLECGLDVVADQLDTINTTLEEVL